MYNFTLVSILKTILNAENNHIDIIRQKMGVQENYIKRFR